MGSLDPMVQNTMRTWLNSWAFVLCLISVFQECAADCSMASSEAEACEKMLLVTKQLPVEQANAFLDEEAYDQELEEKDALVDEESGDQELEEKDTLLNEPAVEKKTK